MDRHSASSGIWYSSSYSDLFQFFTKPKIDITVSSPLHSKEIEDFWGSAPLPTRALPKGLNFKTQELILKVKHGTVHHCKATVTHGQDTEYLIWNSNATRSISTEKVSSSEGTDTKDILVKKDTVSLVVWDAQKTEEGEFIIWNFDPRVPLPLSRVRELSGPSITIEISIFSEEGILGKCSYKLNFESWDKLGMEEVKT